MAAPFQFEKLGKHGMRLHLKFRAGMRNTFQCHIAVDEVDLFMTAKLTKRRCVAYERKLVPPKSWGFPPDTLFIPLGSDFTIRFEYAEVDRLQSTEINFIDKVQQIA